MHYLYWGDLHCHSAASYGHGTPEQALARARGQLDFCSITGHAFWPDMPDDREQYADIIDYHNEGFARLARNWDRLLKLSAAATEPGAFLVFPSYEWHSLEYGDHNVYAPGPQLALKSAPDLPGLRKLAADAGGLVIPHHIGYAAGYRGIDWEHFREEVSPFVEIFSLHGCSLDEWAPYPMLHDMGPRDFGGTAEVGWRRGHRFGIVAGTDHHSAYPGSHGDGRMGVFAPKLTQESLWEAFRARRVFAATGDTIDARFWVDDAWIGSSIRAPNERRLRIAVHAPDALDKVELLKNGRVLRRFFPQPSQKPDAGPYRLRVTWGWGRKSKPIHWNARLTLDGGTLTDVQTCFAGPAIVSPQKTAQPSSRAARPKSSTEEYLPHALLDKGKDFCVWRSITTGNLSTRHATTQALSLGVEAPLDAVLTVEINGNRFAHPLGELLQAGRAHYLRGWLTEAIRIGPLVPVADCTVEADATDTPENEIDVYRLQVAQHNGHWAWLSPIWAER